MQKVQEKSLKQTKYQQIFLHTKIKKTNYSTELELDLIQQKAKQNIGNQKLLKSAILNLLQVTLQAQQLNKN